MGVPIPMFHIRGIAMLVAVTFPQLASGACTCVDTFDYFTEISDDFHYNYEDNFPWAEYDANLNTEVRPWFVARTNMLYRTQSVDAECYAPANDNCNLAFQAFYRYMTVVEYIYNPSNECPGPGQDIVDAIVGKSILQFDLFFCTWGRGDIGTGTYFAYVAKRQLLD